MNGTGPVNGATGYQPDVALKDKQHATDAALLGFATLPRNPKKFSVKIDPADCFGESPQQRVPSTSTPDLLKLYRPQQNASPKLKRVNACKVKRDSTRTSTEEEVDERCVEVVNDKGWFEGMGSACCMFGSLDFTFCDVPLRGFHS